MIKVEPISTNMFLAKTLRYKENRRNFGVRIVVDARRVNVGDFLIEQPLAGANISDAGKEFVEIVIAQSSPGLDAFVVKCKTLDQKFGKPCGSPLAEGGTAGRPNAIAQYRKCLEI